jgi:hypothetical protein
MPRGFESKIIHRKMDLVHSTSVGLIQHILYLRRGLEKGLALSHDFQWIMKRKDVDSLL